MLLRNDVRARRLPPATRRVRLLIVEEGAQCQGTYLSPGECDEVIVLRQSEGESSMDLFVRATLRVADLERTGKQLAVALIAMSPLLDPQRTAVRRMLGLTILHHVQAVGKDSELVLAVDGAAEPELRRDLIAMVESLVAHPGSRHAPIRLRFTAPAELSEDPPLESGIHPCSPPSAAD